MRRTIDLGGSEWELGQVTQVPFGDVNDIAQVHEWLPAHIPGDVRLDLISAGRISDPFYGEQNETSQWVDEFDWWYRRTVDPELSEDERAFLFFEGIDYQSAVFWNGGQLGRHVGMFSRQIFELPKMSNGRSSLAVRVWGSNALPKMSLGLTQQLWKRLLGPLFPITNEPLPDRYATLKCQMQFGWDFAPRLRTCGIWDDVALVIVHSTLMRDVCVRTKSVDERQRQATLEVLVEFDSASPQDVKLSVALQRKGSTAAQCFSYEFALTRGNQTRQFTLVLPDAALWDPWDRGEPNLYEMEFILAARDADVVLDSYVTTFGIRTIQLAVPEGSRTNEPWTMIVNGEREFIRGVNWVPLDAIPGRLTRDDYAARISQARQGNANFLRVWGGGLREKRAFYDLCDEFGILVWQELPYSGAILDRFPSDVGHLGFVRAECGAIVRQLRNHPSVVVWCGGNEFNTRGNHRIVQALRQVVSEHDPTRPFKPASPYRDEEHIWGVWHRMANLRDYQKTRTPFLSEFGLQAPPAVESLERFLPREKLFPTNEMWVYHRAELGKLYRYARVMDTVPDSLEQLVSASQRAQALGVQIAIEHMRRRKGQASGVAIWQLNDPWPAISWSLIDYYGVPKLAFRRMQELYSPVLASFDCELVRRKPGDRIHGDLWLINDLLLEFQDVELSVVLDGEMIYRRIVDIPPDSARRIDVLDFAFGPGKDILQLQLRAGKEILDKHSYELNWADEEEVNPLVALAYNAFSRLMR